MGICHLRPRRLLQPHAEHSQHADRHGIGLVLAVEQETQPQAACDEAAGRQPLGARIVLHQRPDSCSGTEADIEDAVLGLFIHSVAKTTVRDRAEAGVGIPQHHELPGQGMVFLGTTEIVFGKNLHLGPVRIRKPAPYTCLIQHSAASPGTDTQTSEKSGLGALDNSPYGCVATSRRTNVRSSTLRLAPSTQARACFF